MKINPTSLLLLIIVYATTFACSERNNQITKLTIKNKVDHISSLAREPMIVEHASGDLFLTGYKNEGDIPQLWKSTDRGMTWESVNVGNYEDGAQGNSDVDLFIDDDGNIYLLGMTFTKFPENEEDLASTVMKGEQITIGVSRDVGKTWEWQKISEGDYDDRPWIRSTANGNLHIIWNDGNGVHHSMSNDKGKSWVRQDDIYPKGGSSFLASGYDGQLAARIAPLSASGNKMDEGIDLLRLSTDNGSSWIDVNLPGERIWNQDFSGVPRWVEPIAFDEKGKLYSLWSEGNELKLGIAEDQGRGGNWKEYLIEQNEDTIYYPYMVLSGTQILCTWVSGFGENIRHHAAVVDLEEDNLEIYKLDEMELNIWSRFAFEKPSLSTGGEYFPIIPLSNGNFGMATTIQNHQENQFGFTWWELSFDQ